MSKITRLIVAVALMAAAVTPAFANDYIHHPHHGGHHGGSDWIAPLILGGILGAVLSQPRNVYTQPQVVYGQPPIVHDSRFTYRPMYKAVDVYIKECNCYRTVLVQIN